MSDSREFDLSAQDHTDDTGDPDEMPDQPDATKAGADEGRAGRDSVFGAIASLEEQLERIRSAQSGSQELLSSLEDRWKALDASEAEVESQQNALRESERLLRTKQESIEARECAIDEKQHQIEERQRKLEADEHAAEELQQLFEDDRKSVEALRAEVDSERLRIQDAERHLNQEREEFKTEQEQVEQQSAESENRAAERARECDALQDELDEIRNRTDAIILESDALRADHDTATQRMKQAEQNVGDLIQQLEVSQNQLESQGEASKELQCRIDDLEREAGEHRRQIENVETSALEMTEQVEQERDAAQARIKEIEDRLCQAELDREELSTQCETLRGESGDLRVSEEASKQHIEEANQENERLRSECEAANEQRQQAADEIDSLKARAESREVVNTEQAARIDELETDMDERESRIADQESTLQTARVKLAEFADAISEQAEQMQHGAAAIAEVREQQRTIERLKQQLAQASISSDPEEVARKDERIEQLTEALHQARGQSVSGGGSEEQQARIESLENEADELRRQLEHARIEMADVRSELQEQRPEHSDVAEAEIAALQARNLELEAGITEASTTPPASEDGENSKKTAALREAAQHLLRRRTRLARVKHLLKEKEQAMGDRAHDPMSDDLSARTSKLNDQREQLMRTQSELTEERSSLRQAARALAASEQTMVKRWARPRAVTTIAWFAAIAAILAASSWFAADQFFPAVRSASVTLNAEPRPGFPLTDEQRAGWQTWHEGLISDDSFIRTAAKRFGDRRIDQLSEPLDLKKHLAEHMTTDSTQSGELVLTLAGSEPDRLVTVLDTLTLTMLTESRRQQGQRTDGARTSVAGERTEDGRPRYATMNRMLISDDRLQYAAILFGGFMVTALLLIGVVYTRLARARRIFDEDPDMNLMDAIST